MFLPKEIAAAWAPQTKCIQRQGSWVAWYSSTIDWWCLKACISVKLSWHTISARRAMKACGSQIDAGMQVDIHRIAAEGAQEETGGSDRQSLTRTLQRNSAGQGLRHQHRNIGKSVD